MNENGQRTYAPRGPAEIQRFLDAKCDELDQLAIDQQVAHEAQETAEELWTPHYDTIMEELEEELDRLPGEEVRLSIARRRGGAQKWTNLRRAERLVKRLEGRASQIKTIISALQSEAKLMRETV